MTNRSGINATTKEEFYLNSGAASETTTTIWVDRGSSGPDTGIRWNSGTGVWELTNDGSTWQAVCIAPCGGGDLLVGNTLFVDEVNGDNVTATRGSASAPYETIQAALNDANNNDVIKIGPGTFDEMLVIPDSLSAITLKGDGPSTIITSSDAYTIGRDSAAELQSLVLESMWVQNNYIGGNCIYIDGSNAAGYAINDAYAGIDFRHLTVTANTVTDEAIAVTCVRSVEMEDITVVGSIAANEVVELGVNNAKMDDSDLIVSFSNSATVPDGYSSCELKVNATTMNDADLAGVVYGKIDNTYMVYLTYAPAEDVKNVTLNLVGGKVEGTMLVTRASGSNTHFVKAYNSYIGEIDTTDVDVYVYAGYIAGSTEADACDISLYGGFIYPAGFTFVSGGRLIVYINDGTSIIYSA